jgi:hypothetical protein
MSWERNWLEGLTYMQPKCKTTQHREFHIETGFENQEASSETVALSRCRNQETYPCKKIAEM